MLAFKFSKQFRALAFAGRRIRAGIIKHQNEALGLESKTTSTGSLDHRRPPKLLKTFVVSLSNRFIHESQSANQ